MDVAISYCTTCGNRLADLQQTVSHNLGLLRADEELVVIDYNSTDGLWDWLQVYAADFSNLQVFREDRAPRFIIAHAKNIAHLLGRGRVLVNLDADNFLDPEYLAHLRTRDWSSLDMLAASAETGACRGRAAIKRDVFRALGGFDESFIYGYGYEEIDLERRAQQAGYRLSWLTIPEKQCIQTSPALRRAGQLNPKMSVAESNRRHTEMSEANLKANKCVANRGRPWGEAVVVQGNGARRAVSGNS